MATKSNITSAQIVEWATAQEVPNIADLMGLVSDLDLPPGMRKVLIVESLPMTTLMPQSKKAEIAKMSVRQYYNCLHDARFPEAARTVAGRLMGQSATKIMRAFLRDAELGAATNQIHVLQTLALLADPNKKRIELDDVSKPRFSPELSKEVAAVLNEAVESGETDDDPTPADPDAE